MVRLPKINIGTNKRRSFKDFSHDVETTSDFGFCQPTIISHVNADSSSTLQTSVGVRLAPLPCPTFGRIKLKTFNTLVPIQEVYEAFDYQQKQSAVSSAFGSYIPTEAPYMNYYDLFRNIVLFSLNENRKLFDLSNGLPKSFGEVDCNSLLNFTICTPKLTLDNIVDVDGVPNRKMFADYTFVPFGQGQYSGEHFVSGVSDNPLYRSFMHYLVSADFFGVQNGGENSDNLYTTFGSDGAEWKKDFIDRVFNDKVFDGILVWSDFVYSGAPGGTYYDSEQRLPLAMFSGIYDDMFDPVRKSFYFNRGTSNVANSIS